jgi:hypothetical protein
VGLGRGGDDGMVSRRRAAGSGGDKTRSQAGGGVGGGGTGGIGRGGGVTSRLRGTDRNEKTTPGFAEPRSRWEGREKRKNQTVAGSPSARAEVGGRLLGYGIAIPYPR